MFRIVLEFDRAVSGWGVSANVTASSDALVQKAVESLPGGFSVKRGLGPGPRFSVSKIKGVLDLMEGRKKTHYEGASEADWRAAVARTIEYLAANESKTFAFLSGGAVEVNGKAILVTGSSSPETTLLVQALMKGGATLLADGLVPVDRRLRIHPLRRRFGTGAGPLEPRDEAFTQHPTPIGLVWSASLKEGLSSPTFDQTEGVRAFGALLGHAPGARTRPRVVVPILTGIARTRPVFTGFRGDAEEAAVALLARLH